MWRCLFHATFSAWLIVYVLAYDYEDEEIEDDVCADQYENCGVETRTINETVRASPDLYTNNNGTESMGSAGDNIVTRTIRVRRHCCDGLVCKHEGADEEPVPPGVTDFCMDPSDENRERMFDKWKQSLEMPRDYSYHNR